MVAKVLITKSEEYEDDVLFLGYCKAKEHSRFRKDFVVTLEPDSFKEMGEFKETLRKNPNVVSIQIGGHLGKEASAKFNLDSYDEIMKCIVEHCRDLECLALFFNRSSEPEFEEEEMLERLGDLDFETHPHAATWNAFIKTFSASIKHLIFVGTNFTYPIPAFAIRRLLDSAPFLENIEGSFSSQFSVYSDMDFLCLKDKDVPYIVSMTIGLSQVLCCGEKMEVQAFRNLRHLELNFNGEEEFPTTLDIEGLGLKKLQTLKIVPASEDRWMGPTTIIKVSEDNCLKTLVLNGVNISSEFWKDFGVKFPVLRDLIYVNKDKDHSGEVFDLKGFSAMKRLQYLMLQIPSNYNLAQILDLTTGKEEKFQLELFSIQEKNDEKCRQFADEISAYIRKGGIKAGKLRLKLQFPFFSNFQFFRYLHEKMK